MWRMADRVPGQAWAEGPWMCGQIPRQRSYCPSAASSRGWEAGASDQSGSGRSRGLWQRQLPEPHLPGHSRRELPAGERHALSRCRRASSLCSALSGAAILSADASVSCSAFSDAERAPGLQLRQRWKVERTGGAAGNIRRRKAEGIGEAVRDIRRRKAEGIGEGVRDIRR